MAVPPLSMEPTGWFQVAWSDEIVAGSVHPMTYFGRELVAWRSAAGTLTVMDAYCEHLGAHLGYGGHVEGEVIECPFHGWQWNHEGRNTAIPYEDRPNRGRRIRTYPTVERNDSVYIWHDIEGRAPFFDVPDVFSGFDDSADGAGYYPQQRMFRAALQIHPQYVLENGVDFAHFKFVHKTPIVPVFTRHDFTEPVSYVDFTITFEGADTQKIEDIRSGVNAINGGLGVAVTRSWGMIDHRTISAVTPIDASTSDVRFMVYIGRTPDDDSDRAQARAEMFGQNIIDQFCADIEIWRRQRYTPLPALTGAEFAGFTALRNWAKQFYPDGRDGSTDELPDHTAATS